MGTLPSTATPQQQQQQQQQQQRRSLAAGGGAAAAAAASAATGTPLRMLVEMGFERDAAAFALGECNGDVASAAVMLSEAREREREATAAAAATARRPAQVQRPAATQTSPRLASLTASLAPFPETVDTLIYVLRTIEQNPTEPKFRSLKTTNARFAETLGRVPAAVDLLLTCGFTRAGDWLSLPPRADVRVLQAALVALDAVKASDAYISASESLEFAKAVSDSKASAGAEEAERRAKLAARVPAEPPAGEAGNTRVRVKLGSTSLERRFAADHTLQDVVQWIGATAGSLIPQRLAEGKWRLVDATMVVKKPVDVRADARSTLHALGFWPGCDLVVEQSSSSSSSSPSFSR